MSEEKLKQRIADLEQYAFKLESELEFARWENAERDRGFLLEMLDRLSKAWDNRDSAEYEMVKKMISDWITELEKTTEK